jgi:uncharacterized small protein (DUF1192 family)
MSREDKGSCLLTFSVSPISYTVFSLEETLKMCNKSALLSVDAEIESISSRIEGLRSEITRLCQQRQQLRTRRNAVASGLCRIPFDIMCHLLGFLILSEDLVWEDVSTIARPGTHRSRNSRQ